MDFVNVSVILALKDLLPNRKRKKAQRVKAGLIYPFRDTAGELVWAKLIARVNLCQMQILLINCVYLLDGNRLLAHTSITHSETRNQANRAGE